MMPSIASVQQLRQRVDGGLGLLDPAQLRHQLLRLPEVESAGEPPFGRVKPGN